MFAYDVKFGLPELALLTVKSAALQVGIEFDLLKTTGSAETLFVTGRDIDGWTSAFLFGLGAFQDDDFSWHGLIRLGSSV